MSTLTIPRFQGAPISSSLSDFFSDLLIRIILRDARNNLLGLGKELAATLIVVAGNQICINPEAVANIRHTLMIMEKYLESGKNELRMTQEQLATLENFYLSIAESLSLIIIQMADR